jgi:hypothetical protein
MTAEMELVVDAGGDARCIYGEELDLRNPDGGSER